MNPAGGFRRQRGATARQGLSAQELAAAAPLKAMLRAERAARLASIL